VNTKKLSASQLASVQAANNVNAQKLIAADVTKVVGANVQLDSNGQPTQVYTLSVLFYCSAISTNFVFPLFQWMQESIFMQCHKQVCA